MRRSGRPTVTPPTDLFLLEKLPLETREKIALDLDFNEILKLCRSSQQMRDICNDIRFWREKFNNVFDGFAKDPKTTSIQWYKDRIREHPYIMKLYDLIVDRKIRVEYYGEPEDEFEDILDEFDQIKLLYCQDQGLEGLPMMRNILKLNCSNNYITQLPEMPSLVELYCRNNQLRELPELNKLRILDCSNNRLYWLRSMPRLEKLIADGNPLPTYDLRTWREKFWGLEQ